MACDDKARQIDAGHVREAQIGEQDIETSSVDCRDGIARVFNGSRMMTQHTQEFDDRVS